MEADAALSLAKGGKGWTATEAAMHDRTREWTYVGGKPAIMRASAEIMSKRIGELQPNTKVTTPPPM
eukprot:5006702-Prymnesium_polylepis.1